MEEKDKTLQERMGELQIRGEENQSREIIDYRQQKNQEYLPDNISQPKKQTGNTRLKMEEEFECEPYQPKDERNRRFKSDTPKTRSNVMEAAKREEQKAKRIKQSQADSEVNQKIEEEEESEDTRRRSKRILQKNMTKEEKQQLYDKDMEECAKAVKGKHRARI